MSPSPPRPAKSQASRSLREGRSRVGETAQGATSQGATSREATVREAAPRETTSQGPDVGLARHPMRIVSRRTGLKPDLLRAWERRYGAVQPGRSETGRRLYSDADIERLRLLRRAVEAGRGIRLVASLSDSDLRSMIRQDQEASLEPGTRPYRAMRDQPALAKVTELESLEAECLEAILDLDDRRLLGSLQQAAVGLSHRDLVERLLVPFMRQVGELWKDGTLRPMHEHLATVVFRAFIANLRTGEGPNTGSPHLLVTTPTQQLHELGALVVAACAATEGWRTTFLGANLPAEEIAAGARHKGSRAVSLSITYPPDDPLLHHELGRLRGLLGDEVEILVGGQAAAGYRTTLDRIGATPLDTLDDLRRHLRVLRGAPSEP